MWRSRKFIVIAVLVALTLAVSLASVAFAQTGSTDNTTAGNSLLGRVATILGIDQQKVEDAFTQARKDTRAEGNLTIEFKVPRPETSFGSLSSR